MTYENMILQVENNFATITLNRPEVHNSLCNALNEELEHALNAIAKDESIRALIITGGTKVFAAGADIKEMLVASPMEARETSRFGHKLNNMIEELPFPVIAAICGLALGGGCEMALACDFRIMSKTAKLGLPEVGLGILPGAGGTQRLVRLIGPARAKEMILLGTHVKADKALSMGLATAVVPNDQVLDKAIELAQTLSEKPAAALMLAKQSVNLGEEYGLAAGKMFENILFGMAFSTEDQMEGMTAFVQGRKPNYAHSR